MLNFFKKLFGRDESQTQAPEPITQLIPTVATPSTVLKEESVITLKTLVSEFYTLDEKGYSFNIPSEWTLKNRLNNFYASLFGDKFKENLSRLNEEEIEQVYYLCLAAGKLLYDIESTYHIMVRAYRRLLKGEHRSWISQRNYLFLFGFDNKVKIDTNQSYSEYREYCFFLIANPECRFEVASYRDWLWCLRYKQPFFANEICSQRLLEMLKITARSVKQQDKYLMWQAYFILLLNPSDLADESVRFVKSIETNTKSKQLKRQIDRIEVIAQDYKENDGYSWRKINIDNQLFKKQLKSELQGNAIPPIIKPLGLVPTSFNWKFSVEFATGDFSEFKQYCLYETDLTEKDAILGLHISSGEKWMVDLQWYLPSEECHLIRRPSHQRPRIIWRHMYKNPISYQSALKAKALDFDDVHSFPALVNQLQEIFNLNFNKETIISLKGLKVESKGLMEKWLSPCADKVIFEKEPDRSDLN